MSQNTGIAFQFRIAAAHADIVQVGSIISSPGFGESAPIAATKPDVQELTVIAYLTLKYDCNFFSNSLTYFPPKNSLPVPAKKPDNFPDFITLVAA